MKNKLLITILVLSIVINIFLINDNPFFVRNSRDVTYGIASTFTLLFDEVEAFEQAVDNYQQGLISRSELDDVSKEVSYKLYNIEHILIGFQFLTYDQIEGINELESFYYNFGGFPKDYRIEALQDIKMSIRKNHAISLPSYFREYPNSLSGDLPPEVITLLNDFKTIAGKANQIFEEQKHTK